MALSISSPVFNHNGPIPKLYTCQGKDISPRLEWSGAPNGTKSLVLIVDDPDAPDPAAPKRVWVHWVLYDIPPSASGLPEAVNATGRAFLTSTRLGGRVTLRMCFVSWRTTAADVEEIVRRLAEAADRG